MYTLEDVERMYNIKLQKYLKQGVDVSDELDAVLYKEALSEAATMNYINGSNNGAKSKR